MTCIDPEWYSRSVTTNARLGKHHNLLSLPSPLTRNTNIYPHPYFQSPFLSNVNWTLILHSTIFLNHLVHFSLVLFAVRNSTIFLGWFGFEYQKHCYFLLVSLYIMIKLKVNIFYFPNYFIIPSNLPLLSCLSLQIYSNLANYNSKLIRSNSYQFLHLIHYFYYCRYFSYFYY